MSKIATVGKEQAVLLQNGDVVSNGEATITDEHKNNLDNKEQLKTTTKKEKGKCHGKYVRLRNWKTNQQYTDTLHQQTEEVT